jgi:DNA (cytosine-5)-methyltransferase 1
VLDLFSGIGAFSLGLERSGGFRTVAFCECEPFCQQVLRKHWPGVPIYDGVKSLTADRLCTDGIAVDVICGGFPCQDISVAGAGAGIDGSRSGLWREFARLIGDVRPRYALVENVAALLGRGMGDVLGDLAALGYDAEWHCISAVAVGAPHIRDRVWLVAYPDGARELQSCGRVGEERRRAGDGGAEMADAHRARLGIRLEGASGQRTAAVGGGWWEFEPDVGRVAHGVAARVDRLRALGNALVPQIPELLGRAIIRYGK